MNPLRRQPPRRAFMIVQMLIVLGLMGAFVIVADRVFRLSVQTSARAATEQEDLLRLEQAMTALRADVWQAAKVEMPDKTNVHVTAEGADVTWQTLPDGDLKRTEKVTEQQWTGVNLSFERQGAWLVVTRRGAEIALLRQAPPTRGGAK
jgi:type II secretory pathway component PulJ